MSVEKDLITGTIQWKVEYLLTEYPELRDCDKKLFLSYLNIYHDFRAKIESSKSPYQTVKELILDDECPFFESVSRCRRKLQEKYPTLRGKMYVEKKESAKQISLWALGG